MNAPSSLHPAGQEAQHISVLWWWMFAAAVAVYLLVAVYVLVAIRRSGRPEEPERQRFIWLGGIAMPVIVLSVLAGATVGVTVSMRRTSTHEVHVDVVGHDWWWEIRYDDTGLTSANEIHLPVGQTAAIRLTSDDVIHSFWVPQLAGKLDVIPGQTNILRLKPTRSGTFVGECAEFCGVQHANMRLLVVVESRANYDRWIAARGALVSPTDGAAIFQHEACAGCHTIQGTQAAGRVGPDLTEFGRRTWIGAGVAPNTPENLLRWITDPDQMKPGVIMPAFTYLSDAERRALVAYLESLK